MDVRQSDLGMFKHSNSRHFSNQPLQEIVRTPRYILKSDFHRTLQINIGKDSSYGRNSYHMEGGSKWMAMMRGKRLEADVIR